MTTPVVVMLDGRSLARAVVLANEHLERRDRTSGATWQDLAFQAGVDAGFIEPTHQERIARLTSLRDEYAAAGDQARAADYQRLLDRWSEPRFKLLDGNRRRSDDARDVRREEQERGSPIAILVPAIDLVIHVLAAAIEVLRDWASRLTHETPSVVDAPRLGAAGSATDPGPASAAEASS